jgi:T5SS/PEP-CTERM-associated repeat protein
VATVSGNGSTWINSSALAVGGHHGYGTLNIVNGGAVADGVGSIASASYSTGTVSVNGRDSKWTNDSSLYVGVGDQSDGRMNIANGSFVGCNDGYIGYYPGSKGQVNVEGSDSKWSINSSLCVGQSGRGSLYVMGGGTVEATSVSIGGIGSLLAIDVGRNSSIAVDDGAIGLANNNAVRFVAGTGAEAGKSYTPISAHTWTTGPYGVYQAVGGTWDATAHTFTASAIKLGTSGNAVTIDLANEQRVLISDSATGWSVGASFLASSTPASLDFTATAVTGDTLNLLKNQLGIGESVLSSWAFLAKGYTVSSNNPVYLSLKIGSGHVMDDLDLWHYGTNGWTAYSPTDLTYDGTYASFTVTSFSGYAVTGIAVPEPSGAVLLLATAVGLAGYAWRKRWIGR